MLSTRPVLGLAVLAAVLLIAGAPALAHKGAGAGPQDAATWVRQALALLEVKPPNIPEAAERLEGALKAKDSQGMDLALVRQAMEALKARNAEAATAMLTRALLPPPAASAQPLTPSPHHADEEVSAHHLPGAPLKALEPRFQGTAGEYALLSLGGFLIVLGLLGLRRAGKPGAGRVG